MERINVALPKGRLFHDAVELILTAGGIFLDLSDERNQKPSSNFEEFNFFLVRTGTVPGLVGKGYMEVGITGSAHIQDEEADVKIVKLLDILSADLVVASYDTNVLLKKKNIRVVTEYPNIAKRYFYDKKIDFEIIKTRGSAECLVPEIADVIVVHSATGTTLKSHGLTILDTIERSVHSVITQHNISENKVPIVSDFIRRVEEGYSKIVSVNRREKV